MRVVPVRPCRNRNIHSAYAPPRKITPASAAREGQLTTLRATGTHRNHKRNPPSWQMPGQGYSFFGLNTGKRRGTTSFPAIRIMSSQRILMVLALAAAFFACLLVGISCFLFRSALFRHVAATAPFAVRMMMVVRRLLGLKRTGHFFLDFAHGFSLSGDACGVGTPWQTPSLKFGIEL